MSEAKWVPGRVVVRLREGANVRLQGRDVWDALGVRPVAHLDDLDVYLVRVPVGEEEAWSGRFRRDPRVRYAHPDYYYRSETWAARPLAVQPNDPLYPSFQWQLPHIGAPRAWEYTRGRREVKVAVVDTGVDLRHEDLVSNLIAGYDVVDPGSTPYDVEGHGTHVAGIVGAATNNGKGVAGVAWNVSLMPVRVLDWQGQGTSVNVARGIRWAVDHGTRVVNLSLGGPEDSGVLRDAVAYAVRHRVLVVAAAGNEYGEGNPTTYPAAYPGVLAVAATDDQDRHASYSNTGSYVDVAAPGGDPTDNQDPNPRHWIVSTYLSLFDGYVQMAGTSQAAPHVSGLAALILSLRPDMTPIEAGEIITSTARDVAAAGWDEETGWGVIDMAAALAAAGQGQPTPTVTPTATATPPPPRTPTATPTPTPTPAASERVYLQNGRIVFGRPYNGEVDATISAWQPDQNFGESPTLTLRSGNVAHILVRFSLPDPPPGARVSKAWLQMYATRRSSSAKTNVDVYRLLRPWREDGVTWRSTGEGAWQRPGASGDGDRARVRTGRHPLPDLPAWLTWVVTDEVRDWYQHPERNHGFILVAESNAGVQATFLSGEWPDVKHRPRLVIEYALPTGTPTLTPTPVPTRGATPTPTWTPTFTPSPVPATPTPTPSGVWVEMGGIRVVGDWASLSIGYHNVPAGEIMYIETPGTWTYFERSSVYLLQAEGTCRVAFQPPSSLGPGDEFTVRVRFGFDGSSFTRTFRWRPHARHLPLIGNRGRGVPVAGSFLDGCLGHIRGVVYEDKNGNGRRDAGEPGIPGAMVELYNLGKRKGRVLSDGEGRYVFRGLDVGTYALVAYPKGGMTPVNATIYVAIAGAKVYEQDIAYRRPAITRPWRASQASPRGVSPA